MYVDLFANNGNFECWKTNDLNALTWTKVTGISVPSGVRHGSVISVNRWELETAVSRKVVTPPSPTPPPVLRGDVNADGSIDSLDVTVLKRYLLRKITLTQEMLLNADTDGDGAVDSLDLSLLKRYILRKIDSFPA